jgi:AraC family transcriptional regulator
MGPDSTQSPIGHLLMRAMRCLDTDRAAAWHCLKEASTLLGQGPQVQDLEWSASQRTYTVGVLAAWQAKRAVKYIEEHLDSKLDLEQISGVVGLSQSHFSRAFKRSLGSSPMAYVTVRRVERAKRLMISTGDRLIDVALACGFADQSHLTRYFRRVVGISPGRWRRMSPRAIDALG